MFREVHAVERLSDRPPAEMEAELRSEMAQFLGEAAGFEEERSEITK